MNYEICRAVPEQAAEILACLQRIGGETDNLSFGAEGLPFSVEDEKNFIASLENSADGVMMIAKADGMIVGSATLSRLPRRNSHRGELGLSVQKAYWGRGIGTALMESVILYAKGNGYAVIDLQVRCDNDRAIGLYRRFGFQKIGTHPDFSRVGQQAVSYDFMYLDLD